MVETGFSFRLISYWKRLHIAEFMLNLLDLELPPLKSDVTLYITEHYRDGGSQYSFSCDQVFLKATLK